MRPIEEDPGYQEMCRQESAVSHKLASLAQSIVMLPSSGLKPGETVEQRVAKIKELRKQRDELERDQLLIAQAIWNLKASWR